MNKACRIGCPIIGGEQRGFTKCLVVLKLRPGHQSVNWSGRSGSAHSADLCFIRYVFFWVDRGSLRPAARAALAHFLQ